MTTANDILQYLYSIAPKSMQYDWDNTGMLCGRKDKPVKKVLVALDPFATVCQEAADVQADLLVTHHPLIFQAQKAICNDTDMGKAIFHLIQNDITAINAHTNWDCAPGGVNDVLAQQLGLTDIAVVDPQGTDECGREWGLLRIGNTRTQSLAEFMTGVKKALGCKMLRYVDSGKPVSRVCVGGGSCGSDLLSAVEAGCDTFVTADVKYNQFREALSYGINIIDAGHFQTENPSVKVLSKLLQEAFPEITVIFSKNLEDPVNFF